MRNLLVACCLVGLAFAGSADAGTILYMGLNGDLVSQSDTSAGYNDPLNPVMRLYGQAQYSNDVPAKAGLAADAFGQSIYFPQTNWFVDPANRNPDYVAPYFVNGRGGYAPGYDANNTPSLFSTLDQFTLEMWVKVNNDPNSAMFDQGVAAQFGLKGSNAEYIRMKYIQPRASGGANQIYGGGYPDLSQVPNPAISGKTNFTVRTEWAVSWNGAAHNTWHHVVITYDNQYDTNGDTVADATREVLYVDGVLRREQTTIYAGKDASNASVFVTVPAGTQIGGAAVRTMAMLGLGVLDVNGGSGAFRGWVDDVRLSDTVIPPILGDGSVNPASGWAGPLPEPMTMAMLGLGSIGLLIRRRRA